LAWMSVRMAKRMNFLLPPLKHIRSVLRHCDPDQPDTRLARQTSEVTQRSVASSSDKDTTLWPIEAS
jgi:Mg-chelatase subunit ChlI